MCFHRYAQKAILICLISLFFIPLATRARSANIWLEAEDAVGQNWAPGITNMICQDGSGTSGGLYLRLYANQADPKARHTYFADYTFNAVKNGDYRFWIAASPQTVGWASPMYYSIDGATPISCEGIPPASDMYGAPRPQNYFSWFSPGNVTLSAGRHKLRIEVRKNRSMDGMYITFLDAMFFTTDLNFIPATNHPKYSPQPSWQEITSHQTVYEYQAKVTTGIYMKAIKSTNENIGSASEAEVIKKLKARPLPDPKDVDEGIHQFGVHGMEEPFVSHGTNDAQTQPAYDLLARAEVDTFRTAESCWHRLGDDYHDFSQLDYQVEEASKYGMNFMFTLGYPPAKYNMSNTALSTFKPEYEQMFRDYIDTVLKRYNGKYQYLEYCNEVDAPGIWWLGAGPNEYVRDFKIIKEEEQKNSVNAPLVAFAATFSRNETTGGAEGGRNFVRKCFDLGINNIADAYSLHYTWNINERDFPAFFQREMQKAGAVHPMINSEEAGYDQPYDVIKLFARDLYLYGFQSVYYYLARDWFEQGSLISSGLFDLNWHPKRRLLAYAVAADAMKHHRLIGMSKPAKDIEAYVLEILPKYRNKTKGRYSIVMWKNGGLEAIGTGKEAKKTVSPSKVSGIVEAKSVVNWKLDNISIPNKKSPTFSVAADPIVIYTDKLPRWKLISPRAWLANVNTSTAKSKALVPLAP